MEDDLSCQFAAVYEALDAAGIVHLRKEGYEADDVIGTLTMKHGDTNEKILILSGDKDFVQLQRFSNVKQYDPVQKKWRTTNDPDRFIKEHIMRGDTGDGDHSVDGAGE